MRQNRRLARVGEFNAQSRKQPHGFARIGRPPIAIYSNRHEQTSISHRQRRGCGLVRAGFAQSRPLRAGLIGAGWYGKTDLLRLIQVSPVEVVSLCDVDQTMLADAAELVSTPSGIQKEAAHVFRLSQDARGKRSRYRPDGNSRSLARSQGHRGHRSGRRCVVQKPISVSRGSGDPSRRPKTPARGTVGTQRRSTPHLVEARDDHRRRQSGKVGQVEIYCYYHMRTNQSSGHTPPAHLDYEMWTGPAPLRPYNRRCIRAGGAPSWSTATASWVTCTSTCSTWPGGCSVSAGQSGSSIRRHPRPKAAKANITDTQTATFEYDDLKVVWQHRSWGDSRRIRNIPGAQPSMAKRER